MVQPPILKSHTSQIMSDIIDLIEQEEVLIQQVSHVIDDNKAIDIAGSIIAEKMQIVGKIAALQAKIEQQRNNLVTQMLQDEIEKLSLEDLLKLYENRKTENDPYFRERGKKNPKDRPTIKCSQVGFSKQQCELESSLISLKEAQEKYEKQKAKFAKTLAAFMIANLTATYPTDERKIEFIATLSAKEKKRGRKYVEKPVAIIKGVELPLDNSLPPSPVIPLAEAPITSVTIPTDTPIETQGSI